MFDGVNPVLTDGAEGGGTPVFGRNYHCFL